MAGWRCRRRARNAKVHLGGVTGHHRCRAHRGSHDGARSASPTSCTCRVPGRSPVMVMDWLAPIGRIARPGTSSWYPSASAEAPSLRVITRNAAVAVQVTWNVRSSVRPAVTVTVLVLSSPVAPLSARSLSATLWLPGTTASKLVRRRGRATGRLRRRGSPGIRPRQAPGRRWRPSPGSPRCSAVPPGLHSRWRVGGRQRARQTGTASG